MAARPASRPSVRRDPQATRAALVQAAACEFEEIGFDATHSNKIAARAGYAPQTFYRHFTDKIDVFLAVYAQWVAEEQLALDAAGSARRVAQMLVRHHQESLRLRRALRRLAVTDETVRKARALSRLAQIERIRQRLPHLSKVPLARLARSLLVIERVADACAEGEFFDLELPGRSGEDQLVEILRQELLLRR